MAHFSPSQVTKLNDLVGRDAQAALQRLSAYEQKYGNDLSFRANKGGWLIDIGTSLNDTTLIERGIISLTEVLPNLKEHYQPNFLYNLGNGYYELHHLVSQQAGFLFNPDTTPLIKAKDCYRQALKGQKHLKTALLAQLRINYGNCLSGLGRSLEAISEYEKALQLAPKHPMAWGNLGVELEYFAFIARHSSLLQDALAAVNKALANKHLENWGGPAARAAFDRTRQRLESYSPEVKEQVHKRKPQKFLSKHHKAYVEFCLKHHLFLNFCLKNRPCPQPAKDSVSFSLLVALDDTTTVPRLSRVVNEVKEHYTAARLLLYEACYPFLKTRFYDDLTDYDGSPDYAVYGIQPAKLKLAFASAYNVLDKIAFFINDYLKLGMSEHLIHFNSIWRKPNSSTLRAVIAQLHNPHLHGLYDLSRDLGREGELEKLRDLRNYLTHRYLVLHVERIRLLTEADGPAYHLGYREFLSQTIELMQLVRSAVIYLIAFIDHEERIKYQNTKGIVPPLLAHTYRHYPRGPQESPM